jgi:hypothetical protein
MSANDEEQSDRKTARRARLLIQHLLSKKDRRSGLQNQPSSLSQGYSLLPKIRHMSYRLDYSVLPASSHDGIDIRCFEVLGTGIARCSIYLAVHRTSVGSHGWSELPVDNVVRVRATSDSHKIVTVKSWWEGANSACRGN